MLESVLLGAIWYDISVHCELFGGVTNALDINVNSPGRNMRANNNGAANDRTTPPRATAKALVHVLAFINLWSFFNVFSLASVSEAFLQFSSVKQLDLKGRGFSHADNYA